MAARILVLLAGLAAAARGDIRARDPEVEDKPGTVPGQSGWERMIPGAFGTHHHGGAHGHRPATPGPAHHPAGHETRLPPPDGPAYGPLGLPEETAPPTGEARTQHHPARTGNWCAFIHNRVVTTAVSCGTEKYTIKSQSPCPNGTPDCQLVMYKLSTRPVYRQQQKIFTALLWRCCPGHAGHNCEETVTDGHVSDPSNQTAGSALPGASAVRHAGVERLMQLAGDQNREQNDFQLPGSPVYHHLEGEPSAVASTSISEPDLSDFDYKYDRDRNQDHDRGRERDHDHDHDHDRSHDQTGPGGALDTLPGASPFPDAAQLPQMIELLMAQLGPVLDGFNRTLERLSQEADARGVEGPEAGAGDFEAKLEESFHQIDQVKEELRLQRIELEERLHSQHAMLHYNLTNFKTDTDVKIKRNQKTMQINLHSLNASLTEVKLAQQWLEEEVQRGSGGRGGPGHGQLVEGPAVWDAIGKLDNKVVNNTVKVNALLEDLELASGNIRDLQRGFRGLEDKIDQTGRNSQIQFMETGLEVEAAKVEVLNRVNELASNLTLQDEHLKEMDSDMDYLYTQLYRSNATSKDCDCKALVAGLSRLEREVANVTELASENRQALEDSTLGQDRWEVGWGTSVEDLKQGLLQVKESLAFEQDKSRSLHLNMSQLLASHLSSRQEIRGLQESDEKKASEMRRLASSFSSLLKDAIRHTEVLEVLLGEEVLEFKEKPLREQEEYAIPLLRDRIQHTLVQIKHQNLSLTSLLKSMQAHDPAMDDEALTLTEWGSRGLRRRSEDRGEDDLPESPMGDRPDYSVSDFWSLGKEVEDLDAKVSRLEGQRCTSCCNCTRDAAPGGLVEELQVEVALLRRGLEDHLRVFRNIFSNTDGLAGSEGTLDLDKLWALLKKKEEKRLRRQQKEKEVELRESHGGRKASLRSKRDASLETGALAQTTDAPLMFLASTYDGANEAGTVIFERVSLNRGQMYSDVTGTFRAPSAGIYLFILTVEFGPGPSLAYLRRGDTTAAALHQSLAGPVTRVCVLQLERGEQLRFELSEGTIERGNVADNTFSGILLSRDT
ncbi:hypothetical protein AAFF_G00140690 [Aldrovandia affinis]|uniref:Multimerin-2 n=1 Tax=Aldrovandia affinis TaxID=143900 RepID=A0AAD7TCF4_9TELE|nr:hypothetical protein AAFF_G00140690 [Aldrovandia affinis]